MSTTPPMSATGDGGGNRGAPPHKVSSDATSTGLSSRAVEVVRRRAEREREELERRQAALREQQERADRLNAQRENDRRIKARAAQEREEARQMAARIRREESEAVHRQAIDARMKTSENRNKLTHKSSQPSFAFGSSTPRELSYLQNLAKNSKETDRPLATKQIRVDGEQLMTRSAYTPPRTAKVTGSPRTTTTGDNLHQTPVGIAHPGGSRGLRVQRPSTAMTQSLYGPNVQRRSASAATLKPKPPAPKSRESVVRLNTSNSGRPPVAASKTRMAPTKASSTSKLAQSHPPKPVPIKPGKVSKPGVQSMPQTNDEHNELHLSEHTATDRESMGKAEETDDVSVPEEVIAVASDLNVLTGKNVVEEVPVPGIVDLLMPHEELSQKEHTIDQLNNSTNETAIHLSHSALKTDELVPEEPSPLQNKQHEFQQQSHIGNGLEPAHAVNGKAYDAPLEPDHVCLPHSGINGMVNNEEVRDDNDQSMSNADSRSAEQKERDERKARLAAVMSRTRAGASTPQTPATSTPSNGLTEGSSASPTMHRLTDLNNQKLDPSNLVTPTSTNHSLADELAAAESFNGSVYATPLDYRIKESWPSRGDELDADSTFVSVSEDPFAQVPPRYRDGNESKLCEELDSLKF